MKLNILYTRGAFRRQVVCLFHYIPCVGTGGRHLVLYRFHYWNKGMTCAEPYGDFAIRRNKGISQPPNYTVARKMHGGEGLRGRRSTKVWSCPAGSSTQVWSSAPRNVQVVWVSMKTPPPEEKIVFLIFFLKVGRTGRHLE